ncbi:non-specific lipid-transfer protein 1-like [Vicia villosa]|uniref:non-specific lipid-transfer protein 1-like n=1 Tax=Vicia villosa TaxID=3911 RepID=UPI00273AA732|nr:non-specific lipid-transfer protein 1-like [Vicia villosa]
MASSMFIKVTFLAMICLVLDIPLTNAGQTCDEIKTTLLPCVPYLRDQEPTVPVICCNGVRTVTDQARTVAERKDGCECLKASLTSIPGLNPNAAQDLPNKCGVKPAFPVGVNVDCSKIGLQL